MAATNTMFCMSEPETKTYCPTGADDLPELKNFNFHISIIPLLLQPFRQVLTTSAKFLPATLKFWPG